MFLIHKFEELKIIQAYTTANNHSDEVENFYEDLEKPIHVTPIY